MVERVFKHPANVLSLTLKGVTAKIGAFTLNSAMIIGPFASVKEVSS